MSKLHLVFGGRVSDPQGLDFVDLANLDVVLVHSRAFLGLGLHLDLFCLDLFNTSLGYIACFHHF